MILRYESPTVSNSALGRLDSAFSSCPRSALVVAKLLGQFAQRLKGELISRGQLEAMLGSMYIMRKSFVPD